jgi:uncharacterized protein with beta-barrel porin domain
MALDLSGPKTPPPAKRAPASTARAKVKTNEREEALNGLFQLGSAALLIAKQPADAGAVATHGPNIARETANIAENNDNFAKTIDYITAVGPYAGLLTAVMPLVLQIMVNHNKLPAEPLSAFGVMHPDALTAQAQAKAMHQQAEIMQAQQEAMAEIDEMMRAQEAREGDGLHAVRT